MHYNLVMHGSALEYIGVHWSALEYMGGHWNILVQQRITENHSEESAAQLRSNVNVFKLLRSAL